LYDAECSLLAIVKFLVMIDGIVLTSDVDMSSTLSQSIAV